LLGDDQTGLVPPGSGALLVAPAIAVVLADDLHVPSLADAQGAMLGLTLALAWSLADDEREARAQGLGPGAAREVGTHLGPWLTTAGQLESADRFSLELSTGDGAKSSVAIEIDPDRLTRAILRAGRFGDLRAGDVLLLPSSERAAVEPGVDVSLRSEKLGTLRGRQGRRRSRTASLSLALRSHPGPRAFTADPRIRSPDECSSGSSR
jgi:2-keto-4-pentenoate hydratase/2-oxohepta-3-ene-1,7-dioic acid hydratase in catechol pathway